MEMVSTRKLKSNFRSERAAKRAALWRSSERGNHQCASVWRFKRLVLPIVVLVPSVFFFIPLFDDKEAYDPYAQPFCNADGICHEKPYVPSARTVYSAWNKKQYHLWWKYFHALEEKTSEYAQKRQAIFQDSTKSEQTSTNQTRPLILLGDSITESWLGTGMGEPRKRASGVPEVLHNELSESFGFDPIVLGISGDQTQHLLYRLEHDHVRAARLSKADETVEYFYDPSAVFVVMIGTNNLGSGEVPSETAKGIIAVTEYILEETKTDGSSVILFKILPRGDGETVLPKLCPPRCSNMTLQTPYASFIPAIDKVNEELRVRVQHLKKRYPSRIELIDCGEKFLNSMYDPQASDSYEVQKHLMPDMLHPNADGHKVLAKCIRDAIGHEQT